MSERHDCDLICIGSGPAGQRAAVQAAKLGKRVVLIEKQRCIGGVCIETGTIPSKTFREAVRRLYAPAPLDGSDTSVYGAAIRPTMPQLVNQVGRVMQLEVQNISDALRRNDVDLVHGHAAFVDANTVRVDEANGHRLISSDYILVAVGTQPSKPDGVEPDGQTLITSDDILNLHQLPITLAVVGAGGVGIEYASMFAALGVQVTVSGQPPRRLKLVAQGIGDELTHHWRKRGGMLRCGDAGARSDIVDTQQRQGLILLASGKHLVADVILFSARRVGA